MSEPRKVVTRGEGWNTLHFLEIASAVARLRTHAQRALHEADYKPMHGWSRREYAEMTRVLAKKIEDRRNLRLGCKYWVDLALDQLELYDRENPA